MVLWHGLFGLNEPALLAYIQQFHDPQIAGDPAIVFADQSKAFERLSHPWMAEVLRRWGLPRWLLIGLLDQAVGRQVRSPLGVSFIGGSLSCGVGMGGTASTLWNVCYDPILSFVERVAQVTVDAYVDDCAILTHGPCQTVA
ncbi:MAG: reverse transcriptase domain-containing protein, partial [Candidatus Fonsibacter sp.]